MRQPKLKIFKHTLPLIAAMSAATLSLAHADVAPVVDIQNNHMQLAANTAAKPAAVTDVSDSSSDVSDTNDSNDGNDNSGDSTDSNATPAASTTLPDNMANMPLEQRVMLLSKQLRNLIAMNLPQQISDLQNQIQQLRGQLQVQSHDLQLLNNQQRSFYQDVDQRIQQLKILVNSNGSDSSSSSSSSAPATPAPAAPKTSSMMSKPLANDAASADFNLKDAKTYQAAFSNILKKQFAKAQAGFDQYLRVYPNGRYAANAHYWLGEIYLRQGNSEKAQRAFNTVIKDYASSNKVADSRLKIAMIHMSQGKAKRATQEYKAIKQQYPGTTAAQLASIQLQQIAASQTSNHVQ